MDRLDNDRRQRPDLRLGAPYLVGKTVGGGPHESDRQFRSLGAGVTDYALYMLDPTGIVSSWNAGAERIKGYTAEEIIGRHFSQFYTPDDRKAGLPNRSLAIAAATGTFEAEAWRIRKDGSVFWANAVIDAIHDETGKLIGFAKITRDITERRNAQKPSTAHTATRADAKMEALGQLTGGVAHDFNNLLMVVSGQAQALMRRMIDKKHALAGSDPGGGFARGNTHAAIAYLRSPPAAESPHGPPRQDGHGISRRALELGARQD
jgi:PAS domain S-box-containing protein